MRARAALVLVLVAACRPPGHGKDGDDGDDVPSIDAAATDAPVTGDPDGPDPVDAAPDAAITCRKTFRLEGNATATSALVTGEFVNWAGSATDGALAMALADGVWTAQRDFGAGTYQYRFIVDGTWMPDPGNPDQVPNGLGGFNSVVRCP